MLFNPELFGHELPSVNKLIEDSIKRCDLELRPFLYSNIVLAGGTTMIPGFASRLLMELKKAKGKKDLKILVLKIHVLKNLK